jgi:hypothetical protein
MPGTPQKVILPYGQPAACAGEVTRRIDSDSRINAELVTNLGFGLGVAPGTLTKSCLLPSGPTSVLLGVTSIERRFSAGTFGQLDTQSVPPGLRPKASIDVLTEGRIWVVVDADTVIVPGITRAFWRWVGDGVSNNLIGTFRHTDDGRVVDVRRQVLFVSLMLDAADVLHGAGSQKIAEVVVARSNQA